MEVDIDIYRARIGTAMRRWTWKPVLQSGKVKIEI
jgi:hypothetical protein